MYQQIEVLTDYQFDLQPYMKDLRDEIRDFYFANVTTDFERADRFLVLNNDIIMNYFIEEWLLKQISVSQRDTYYHRYYSLNTYGIL